MENMWKTRKLNYKSYPDHGKNFADNKITIHIWIMWPTSQIKFKSYQDNAKNLANKKNYT